MTGRYVSKCHEESMNENACVGVGRVFCFPRWTLANARNRVAGRALIVVASGMFALSCADDSIEAPPAETGATDVGFSDVDAGAIDASQADAPARAWDAATSEDVTWSISTPRYVDLVHFEGGYDPGTGEFYVSSIAAAASEGSSYRTVSQALWCPIATGGVEPVRLYSTEDPQAMMPGDAVHSACQGDGVNDAPFGVFGALCGTVRLESLMPDETLYNVHAEINEFTGSDQQIGYRYPLGSGAPIPHDDYPLSQQYGLWSYGDAHPSDTLDIMWTFRNADLSGAPFRFSGRVVSAVQECTAERGPNGIDDDCDGIIDNGCGIFTGDEACVVDEDCESGSCIEGPDGRVCTYHCPSGVFGVTCGNECPGGAANPCSGQGVCDDGADGTGICVCEPGYAEDDCAVTCPGGPTCSGGGVCDTSGAAPTCYCDPLMGTHGEACAYTCDDGVANGDETDADCGGAHCEPCDDEQGCATSADCASGVCTAGTCQIPTCSDGVRNGNETDTDCGGPDCPGCGTHGTCSLASDCASGVCVDGSCLAPTCSDGVLNGDETGVDCGGPFCDPCGQGVGCSLPSDCESVSCVDGSCAAPTCTDNVSNGNETGIDCGGPDCPPCGEGEGCTGAGDCISGVCTDGSCQAPSCSDAVLNGDETDVDCGGPDCPACAVGGICSADSDCTSGVCSGGTCQAPSCSDLVLNGDETDVDCGGPSCPSCPIGGACLVAGDCGEVVTTAWDACGGYATTCSNEGTQSRTVTTPVCTQDGCDLVTTTETQTCSRDTSGTACDEIVYGPWGACGGYVGTCGNAGTRSRSVTTFTCGAGTCQSSTTTETEPCTRDTTGTTCGDVEYGAWSACASVGGDCDTTGTRSRTVTTFACGAGSCQPTTTTETEACLVDADGGSCGDVEYGAWGACGSFSGTCGNSGTRSRTVTTYTCAGGSCVPSVSNEVGACTRDTSGASCGDVVYGAWSACGGFSGTCGNNGTRSRSVTTFTCGAGTCQSSTTTETEACTRNTNGTSCDVTQYGTWSACGGFSGTCGNNGTRSRSVTTYACNGGSCQSSTSTESESCSRDTTGTTCASTQTGTFSPCGGYDGTCGNVGTQSRTVTTYTCEFGSCQPNPTTQTQSCSRDTTGMPCAVTQYGAWSACGGFSGTCGNNGTRSRSVTTFTCGAGTCQSSTTTETEACTRNTNGTTCDVTQTGSWGACGGFSGTCGNTGTRSRTVTTYTCNGGSCQSSTSTQTEACNRNTNGTSCGTTQTSSWSACGGFSGTCGNSGTRSRTVTTYTCGSGSCQTSTTTQSEACTRNTNGTTCDVTQTGSWGACGGFSGTCGNSGTRSRTVTTYTCSGGSCQASTSSQSEACTRNTNGTSCDVTQTGSWSACSYASTCATSGTRTRSVTTYTCSGGSCQGSTTTEAGSCSRSTNGTSCGVTQTGSWSACGGFANACSTSGTQTRSVTTYTCSGGGCAASTTTQSQSCTRSTNGTSCGTTQAGSWSACSYSSTCATTGTRTRTVTNYTCSGGSCQTSTSTETGSCSRSTQGSTCGTTTTSYGQCHAFPECSTTGSQTITTTTHTCNNGSCQGNTSTTSQSCTPFTECAPCWTGGAGICWGGSCRQGYLCP